MSLHFNEKVQQPARGTLMVEGLEGPGVTLPSTRRSTRNAEPFNEAEISRSADPVCRDLHRILFAYCRDGGDTNRGANTSPMMWWLAPTRRLCAP